MSQSLPTSLSLRGRALYWAEQLLSHLILPFLALMALPRLFKGQAHLAQRLGLGPFSAKGGVVIHLPDHDALQAQVPLIRNLLTQGIKVTLCHTSPEGLAEGRRHISHRSLTHRLSPSELFWAHRLFLTRAAPRLLILTEHEIWPALIREGHRIAVPMVAINAQLDRDDSAKSPFHLWLNSHYQLLRHIFTRTSEDQAAFLALDIPPARLTVTGDMEEELWIDPLHLEVAARLRHDWPAQVPVIMIAGSRRDEEGLFLDIIAGLRQREGLGELRVIWAPASSSRFAPVAVAMGERGLTMYRRSYWEDLASAVLPQKAASILCDTQGEMTLFYPLADLVLLGGSFGERGGSDLRTPLVMGVPVLTGPNLQAPADLEAAAYEVGAMDRLLDPAQLEARMADLLLHRREDLARLKDGARTFAQQQTGALARIRDVLDRLA